MLNSIISARLRRLFLYVFGVSVVIGLASLFEPAYGKVCHYNEYNDAEKCSLEPLAVLRLRRGRLRGSPSLSETPHESKRNSPTEAGNTSEQQSGLLLKCPMSHQSQTKMGKPSCGPGQTAAPFLQIPKDRGLLGFSPPLCGGRTKYPGMSGPRQKPSKRSA